MGKTSRTKGAKFERKVAKLIIATANNVLKLDHHAKLGSKDCYRTPMSGGHPHAGASDLVLSKRLRKSFPFCVECKHTKGWKPVQMFKLLGNVKSWIDQVSHAVSRDRHLRYPMLIVSGNATPIFVAIPTDVLVSLNKRVQRQSCFVFRYKRREWRMMLLAQFLVRYFEELEVCQ